MSNIKKIRKAVFPVGGLGTRFLPATKALPKEMMPVANKPLIQHAFEEAKAAGIEQFIFVTGRNKNIINDHFDCAYEIESMLCNNAKYETLKLTKDWLPNPGDIAFVRQQSPLGLGHAVWCARNLIGNEPFALLLADELFVSQKSTSLLSEMIAMYHKTPGNIIAVSDVDISLTSRYGIVKSANDNGETMNIIGMVEKPKPDVAPSNISIVGRYILEPEIFNVLAKIEAQAGEVQLTDALLEMISNHNVATYGYRFSGQRMDCGNYLGYLEANLKLALLDQDLKDKVKNICTILSAS